jgi:hypothetical protein
VRKYKVAKRSTFDDLRWPVNMALVVLGGFLVGGILAYQRPDDPRWYASPWVSIILVGLLICSSMLTLSYTPNRLLRRTMQFSIVICAILHLVLLVISLENSIFSRSWTEQVSQRNVMQKRRVTAPPRHPLQVNQPSEDLDVDRPVQTPEPEPVPRDIDRPEPEPQQTPLPPQPQPVERPQPAQPEVVQNRAQQSPMVPRMSQHRSQLSRRESESETASAVAVEVPVQQRQQPSSRPSLQASTQQTARAATSAMANRSVQPVESASESPPQASNVQRAVSQQQAVTEAVSQTNTPRTRQENASQPRTQAIPVPTEQAVARKTPEPAPTPRNTLARQQTTRTNEQQPMPQPVVQATEPLRRQPSPQQPTPRQLTLAQTPQPVDNMQRRLTQRLNTTPAEVTPLAQQAQPSEQPRALEPVARSAPARSTPQTTQRAVAATQPVTEQVSPRRNNTQRQQLETEATTTQSAQISRQQNLVSAATTRVSPIESASVGVASAAPSQLQASSVDLQRQAAVASSTRRAVQNVEQADQATSSVRNQTTSTSRAQTSREAVNAEATAAQESPASSQRQTASRSVDRGERVESIESPQPIARSQLGSIAASTAQLNRSESSDTATRAQVSAADQPSTSSVSEQSAISSARTQQQNTLAIARPGENEVPRSQRRAQTAESASMAQRPNLVSSNEPEEGIQAAASALNAGQVAVQRQVTAANQGPSGTPLEVSEQGDAQSVTGSAIARAELKATSLQKAGQAGSPDDALADQSLGATAGSSPARRQSAGLNASLVATEIAAPAPTQGDTDAAPAGGTLNAGASQLARAEGSEPAESTAGQRVSQADNLAAAVQGEPTSSTPLPRAEAVDAQNGQPQLGGGNVLPRQASEGSPLATQNQSTTIEVAGAEASAGNVQGTPLDTEGTTGRLASGTPGIPLERPSGAPEGEIAAPGSGATVGAVLGRTDRQDGSAEGPTSTRADSPGATLGRQQLASEVAGAMGRDIDIPTAGVPGESIAEVDEPGSSFQVGPVARQDVEGLQVDANAPEGVGGLGAEFSLEIGIADRRAREDSTNVQLSAARFVKQGVSGLPSMNAMAQVATESFKGRTSRDGGGRGTPPPQTEEAIELGLAFLARYQQDDGSWALDQFARLDNTPLMVSNDAATGLAVMAFQGAGYTHNQFKYKDVLRAAIDYLISNQNEDGDYYFSQGSQGNQVVRLYSHAIVTLALCESYGMTQDPELRESVQKGLDFIVQSQHADRGGWRYTPGRESDTSVGGWMITALESGRRAGLEVPEQTMIKAVNWLDQAQDPDHEYLYRYNPYAPDGQGQGRLATKTMTSVGLLMRLYSGWKVADPRAIEGAEYLKRNLPSLGRGRSGSQRDTYYWYYATQFMFHMGGDYWKAWNDRLYPLLLNTQKTRGDLAGSWDPRLPTPDRWGSHAGRIYVTTMNLLSLEVHYRYLPLYDDSPYKPEVAMDGSQ